MAKQYSHSERQQHLEACQQSGLSKQQYCQQQTIASGVKAKTFEGNNLFLYICSLQDIIIDNTQTIIFNKISRNLLIFIDC